MTRTEARDRIIGAANTHRYKRWQCTPQSVLVRVRMLDAVPLFGLHQIERAVCVVRRHRLVSDDVLVAAGFKAPS